MLLAAPNSSSSRMMLVRQSTTVPKTSNSKALTCETSLIREPPLPRLRAMAQGMIREHDGHHGFTHRHRADADAGVVATLGHDLRLVAEAVDRLPRGENRRGRLDGEAAHDRLPGGNAAEDA